ncbi:alpha-amylase/4-alpha-glucanotransferase domain-containing protein [Nitrospina gracilis]|uniref:alpha-amylase/4-alpha-glucanotransferase domain-containing protein n=1 Tax=Nitrospina gracilis TaxID=35801 RepID=UPI001F01D42A|nr:alpha-amylase/4-alpha-glucanotransferase domain-containing protein [Nitrospina gracilis]MCF8721874.1 alpha-amylase [Nitrospina gracilis Nb-211]
MRKLKLLFGVHNHQPVGNFDHVFEELFEKSYRPYFDVLEPFESLRTAAHFTGPLLEWMQKHRPDFFKRLRDLVRAGRLEMMSGGFYEPILSSLPEEDAVGQIRMMNEFLEAEFGQPPRGLWLAERIWSPTLPGLLSQAGIEYTVLDDTHFYYAGLETNQISGHYITENQGHALKVFPISKTLRYSIPFDLPEKTLEHLKRFRDESGFDAVTYADDGEKFGGWPETYEWVYEKGYLKNLFAALEANRDWLETVTFSDYIQSTPPVGRVYLPMASYDEMMEWALPHRAASRFEDFKEQLKERGLLEEDGYRTFLRGGQWDNFLTKYEESNLMHKKMLYVSRKVHRLTLEQQKESGALRELYRGQCNCAQWHGLFGGLYLNYLRHALYNHLIAAENIADALLGGNDRGLQVEVLDYNHDGHEEVIVSNPLMTAGIVPAYGGAVFELDCRPVCFNLSNVLKRREEAYHRQLEKADAPHTVGEGQPASIHDRVRAKEPGLRDRLFYDANERYSFMERFLPPGTTLTDMKSSRYRELGDFTGQPYEVMRRPDAAAGAPFELELRREGTVAGDAGAHPVRVNKQYAFDPDRGGMTVSVTVTNTGDRALNMLWAEEFNFTLLAGDAPDRYYLSPGFGSERPRMNSEGELSGVKRFGLCDEAFGFSLMLESEPEGAWWWYPAETISQSEEGFERTYQGSCLLNVRLLRLNAGEVCGATWNLTLSVAGEETFQAKGS